MYIDALQTQVKDVFVDRCSVERFLPVMCTEVSQRFVQALALRAKPQEGRSAMDTPKYCVSVETTLLVFTSRMVEVRSPTWLSAILHAEA